MAFTLPTGFETYFKEWEEKIGAFVSSVFSAAPFQFPETEETKRPAGDSKIAGLPFAVKDNIALKGASWGCGSKMLENLKAPFTAFAVEKLIASGCVPLGKTRLDEFGMSSRAENTEGSFVNNPWDTKRSAGGPGEGSAAAVAAGLAPFALGSDTGGALRQAAAFCGAAGLKPTFGAVSRYGLAACGSSLETIGVLADSAARCRAVFDVIRGADPSDQSSVDVPGEAPPLYGASGAGSKGRVIGALNVSALIKAMAEDFGEPSNERNALKTAAGAAELESEMTRGFETAKANLAALGYTLKEVEIPSIKYAVPSFYTIAAAEASAALARFDGIRFGNRPGWAENPDELVDKSRNGGFGSEVKLQILFGTHVLRSGLKERYFSPAHRIRSCIKQSFEALLGGPYPLAAGDYDAILLPVFPVRAYLNGAAPFSPVARKAADIYTCSANLAGLPALSFPASVENGLPAGVQLMGRAFSEGVLLDIAEAYENAYGFPHPAGYKKFWN